MWNWSSSKHRLLEFTNQKAFEVKVLVFSQRLRCLGWPLSGTVASNQFKSIDVFTNICWSFCSWILQHVIGAFSIHGNVHRTIFWVLDCWQVNKAFRRSRDIDSHNSVRGAISASSVVKYLHSLPTSSPNYRGSVQILKILPSLVSCKVYSS